MKHLVFLSFVHFAEIIISLTLSEAVVQAGAAKKQNNKVATQVTTGKSSGITQVTSMSSAKTGSTAATVVTNVSSIGTDLSSKQTSVATSVASDMESSGVESGAVESSVIDASEVEASEVDDVDDEEEEVRKE